MMARCSGTAAEWADWSWGVREDARSEQGMHGGS
jgi:hypothetical protein